MSLQKLIKTRTRYISQFTVHSKTKFPVLTLFPLLFPCSITISLVIALLLIRTVVQTTTESLRVVHGVGMGIERSNFYGVRTQTRFIEIECIEDVLITEVITSNDVVFHLVLVLKHETKLVVVFENRPPALKILNEVYRDLVELLL